MMRGDAAADDDDDVHALSVSCACVCVEREERERERETERESRGGPRGLRVGAKSSGVSSQSDFCLQRLASVLHPPPRFSFSSFVRQVPQDGCMWAVTLPAAGALGDKFLDLWCLHWRRRGQLPTKNPWKPGLHRPSRRPPTDSPGTPSPPCHPPPSLPTTGVVSLVASSRSTTPASASCPSQMRQDVSAGSPPFPRSLRHRIHPHRCRFAPTCACPPPPVRPFPSAPRTASPRRRPTPPPRGRPRQIPCR